MEIHLRGLPNTQKHMFDGKKRFFHIMCQVCTLGTQRTQPFVMADSSTCLRWRAAHPPHPGTLARTQGRFKRPVPASSLCMGQEFVKPGNAPPWVGELVFTAAAKVFSNSTQVDAYATLPYFMNPLLAACQLVNVSAPGSAPAMVDAQEDMRLFSPALADKNSEWGPATSVAAWQSSWASRGSGHAATHSGRCCMQCPHSCQCRRRLHCRSCPQTSRCRPPSGASGATCPRTWRA